MATKRRKSRKSCKHGKLKRPVRTKKGGKRRCKKSRKSRRRRRRRRKSRRRKKSFRMNCKLLEQNEQCSEIKDPVSLELIDYDNYQNYYRLLDANGVGRQCISVDTYRDLPKPKENPLTREPIKCPPTLEEQLYELNDEEKSLFLDDYGITESGLDKLINASYETLNLITYFTARKH